MNKFLQKSIAIMFITIIFMLDLPTVSAQVYTAKVQKVVDGDTVRLNHPILGSRNVRLLSIDTPETNFQGRNQDHMHMQLQIIYLNSYQLEQP